MLFYAVGDRDSGSKRKSRWRTGNLTRSRRPSTGRTGGSEQANMQIKDWQNTKPNRRVATILMDKVLSIYNMYYNINIHCINK